MFESSRPNKSNSFNFIEYECYNTTQENHCEIFVECRENYFIAMKELKMTKLVQRTKSSMWLIFVFGILLGLLCGGSFIGLVNIYLNRRFFHKERKFRIQEEIGK